MTQLPQTRRRRPVLRFLGVVVALALTVLGIFWITVSTSAVLSRVGFPVALWGVLIGAFALHGTRWTHPPAAVPAPDPAAATAAPPIGEEADLRRSGELEVAADTELRREFQQQLQDMLDREMARILRQELAALRADVAGLRGEVLDAVDGRLRLERIETTRVVGSDLAALQSEVRRLNVERETVPIGRLGRELGVLRAGPAISGGASRQPAHQGDDHGYGVQADDHHRAADQASNNQEPLSHDPGRHEPDLSSRQPRQDDTGGGEGLRRGTEVWTPPLRRPADVLSAGAAAVHLTDDVREAPDSAARPVPENAVAPPGWPSAAGDRSTAASASSVRPATAPAEPAAPDAAGTPQPSSDAGRTPPRVTPQVEPDPFAGLPRLSAFRVPEPSGRSTEPLGGPEPSAERAPSSVGPFAAPQAVASAGEYVGRRRRS